MRNYFKYVTLAAYLTSQTVGLAAEQNTARNQSTNVAYEGAVRDFNDAVAQYKKVGPQGLLDKSGLLLDETDRQFIVSKLQSRHAAFPEVGTAAVANGAVILKLSGQETYTIKLIDKDRGLFELNGKAFHINPRESFAHNFIEIERVVNETKGVSAHASANTGIWQMIQHKVYLSLNQIFPTAQADALLIVGIVAAVIGLGLIAYTIGHKVGVSSANTKFADRAAKRADDGSGTRTNQFDASNSLAGSPSSAVQIVKDQTGHIAGT